MRAPRVGPDGLIRWYPADMSRSARIFWGLVAALLAASAFFAAGTEARRGQDVPAEGP